jgi:predicted phage tail protein
MVYDGSRIPTVTSFQTVKVQSGDAYKFRVLAINRVGASALSAFSDVIFAATTPDRPNQPHFVSATSSSITLQFDKVANEGGVPVTNYILYIDRGDLQAMDFQPITSYDGRSLIVTVTMAAESYLVPGERYRFAVSAVNQIGESLKSNYNTFAMAARAAAPTQPTVNRELSSLTSLYI